MFAHLIVAVLMGYTPDAGTAGNYDVGVLILYKQRGPYRYKSVAWRGGQADDDGDELIRDARELGSSGPAP